MSQHTTRFIVTANDLFSGDVVYLTDSQGWASSIAEAAIADDEDAAGHLLAVAERDHSKIVGPYIADVSVSPDGAVQPNHFREVFRTRGPSNYFHGKQAEV